jgi:hypothetical protein
MLFPVVPGYIREDMFNVGQSHVLDSILEEAIESFEATALTFAKDAIHDAGVRQWYMSNISRMASKVREEVKSGKTSVQEGAKFCNEARNKIMEEARAISSAHGRKIAEAKKPIGPTLAELEKKYGEDLLQKKFLELTPSEKKKVYESIVDAAGRDNAEFTSGTQQMRAMGKVFVVITALVATRAICQADNKIKESAKQTAIIGGGAAGGYLGGLAASSACGPGAWVCAIGWTLVGTLTGGFVAESVVDSLDDELEEFSKWMIR